MSTATSVLSSGTRPFEEAKYYHNRRMLGRNKILLAMEFALWFGVTGLLFHWIPRWKGKSESLDAGKFFSIATLAFVVSVVAPLVLSWLLPPPIDWFPRVFKDIHDAQVGAAVRAIRRSL